MAHLPPILARRQSLKNNFAAKMPLRTHAKGGQVEPVLASQSYNKPMIDSSNHFNV